MASSRFRVVPVVGVFVAACSAPATPAVGVTEDAFTDASIDIAGATYVDTGTFSVARLGVSLSPVLQTSGVVPCVAVALLDPISGVGALAHIHPSQDAASSLSEVLFQATSAGLDRHTAIVHVVGGMDVVGSRELVDAVLAALQTEGLSVSFTDVLGPTQSRSLQLNLETGIIAPYFETGNGGRTPDPYDGPISLFRPAPN